MQADNNQNNRVAIGLIEGLDPNSVISDIWKLVEEGLLDLFYNHKDVKPEKTLNFHLLNWLSVETYKRDRCVYRFLSEEPENKQSGQSRSIDFSVRPKFDLSERFFAFEAKILGLTVKNETEYLIGKKKQSGGIERIKKELHVEDLNNAGMVGYMKTESFEFWFDDLNTSIKKLSKDKKDNWNDDDIIIKEKFEDNLAHLYSEHSRLLKPKIKLLHIWINLIQ